MYLPNLYDGLKVQHSVTFLLFFKHMKYIPSSGPLLLPFLPPRMLFSWIVMFALNSFKSIFKHHLLREALPFPPT